MNSTFLRGFWKILEKVAKIPRFVVDDKKGYKNFWGMKLKFVTSFWV